MEVEEMNNCLSKFYLSARREDGSYYKKTSLLSIRAALGPVHTSHFCRVKFNSRPSPFFLCLASSNRPRFSRFQKKKKKSYADGKEGNDTLFQTIFTLI